MFEDITKIILLSDMDGTLLNSRKQITDTDRAAIEHFRKLGGHFSVATGRTIQSFEQYCPLIGITDPVIMYNGAAIYDYSAGETLFTKPLPAAARDITARLLADMPGAGGEVLRTDGTYIFRNNEYEQLHTDLCKIVPFMMPLDEIPDGGWLKVLFAMAPEDVPVMEVFAGQSAFDSVSFVRSADIFLEMLPAGVTKGSALDEYRKLPGFEDFTFVSIGDFDNDIEMIRNADLGACPANAEDDVKAAADLVLEHSCEDGAVAELIEHIIKRCGA